MRILLAEDDRATQLRLAAYVKEWGYHPVAANDGAEAWALFEEEAFDCVISDWMMPEVNGLELIQKIRQAERDAYVYIILLTGQAEKQYLVEGMEAGADDFVAKPFDKDELRVRLRAGQRIVELERRLAERNRELSMFSSVASHDLREPLRTISSFLGLFEKKYKGKLDQEADEYIGFVMDGAARMRTLISDLLSYARLEAHERSFEAVDMNGLVEEKLQFLGRAIDECGAKITYSTLPTIHGDRTQLSQLMQNLIGNGIKYRAQDTQPVIHLNAEPKDDVWVFSVADNGIGIPEEHHDTIFEPFRRLHGTGSHYSGSGVGLSICRKVVQRHGGRIWIEPNNPQGSIFLFTIPREVQREKSHA